MAYKSWGSASWSTSNADGRFVGGNRVALVVASVAVPNQLSLLRMAVEVVVEVEAQAQAEVEVEVEVAGAVSGAALIVAVVGSAEVVVGLVEVAEEGTEIEDLETGEEAVSEVVVAAASEEVEMTLDHREVEVASGVGVVVWATRVVDSMTVHLPTTDTEDLLGPVLALVGLVDQVGMVLLAGVQDMVPPAAVGLVVWAVTEDISNGRVREVSTTETQSGHGTRFDANCTPPGEVHVGGMIGISPSPLSLLALSPFVCLMGLVSIAWRLWVVNCR